MKSIRKGRKSILMLVLGITIMFNAIGQDLPPLVYDVEFTGIDCTKPPLPDFSELPAVEPLTDPFEWSDGSGRDTSFTSWAHRRAEIKAELEHYEIGLKPERPDTITASYAGGVLTVNVTENGNTLTLTSQVTLPSGTGPFPAIIGIGLGTGSLPADIFTSRDIAQLAFNFGQVMAHTQTRGNEPINALYPELTYIGAYSAWSWGVSRLIDGLELVAADLPIDLEHIGITGCSFAGKMALWAGALDERIALTIPQEPGGGGAAAWRVSETLGSVEKLGATNSAWFIQDMFQFGGKNVSKLPTDHHELMAMVAPRALLVLGNPSQVWLAEESGYTSCEAARLVWDEFGIADRMGFSFNADHGHCALPDIQKPEVEAFVDKFLLGDTTANTEVTIHEYDYVIPEYWTDWWGTGNPEFANLDRGESEEFWFEAECGEVGTAWNVRLDTIASNESYVISKPGLTSAKEAPSDENSYISFPFTSSKTSRYYIYALVNCPSHNGDSYRFKFDDESSSAVYDLRTNGWAWKKFGQADLSAGEHTLNITYFNEGPKLDKICVSEFTYPPGKQGEAAEIICIPDTTTKEYIAPTALYTIESLEGYALKQNYPNPVSSSSIITFEIPKSGFVSLKVYSSLGKEIAELAGKEYTAGKHVVEFDAQDYSNGIYFYRLKAGEFSASQKMLVQSD